MGFSWLDEKGEGDKEVYGIDEEEKRGGWEKVYRVVFCEVVEFECEDGGLYFMKKVRCRVD